MIELREATAGDRQAILALRQRCFPDEDVEKQEPRFWQWEFGEGRMFVAADGDRLVAHLGFVPQTWAIDDERCPGMLAVDAMTDPDYRRQHLFHRVAGFAREALRSGIALSTAFQIREAVLPPMQSNGWMPVPRAPVLVKMLTIRPARTPPPVPNTIAAPPERLAAVAGQFFTRGAYVVRDAKYLAWRFYENPLYTVDANDDAYIVTRRTMLRGYDTLAIADIAWRAGKMRDGRVLLAEVLKRARVQGVHLAAALLTLSHPALPALVRSGFLPSPHRFRFLVNVLDARLRIARARWALSWADTDHL